jgi:hypothetical protein
MPGLHHCPADTLLLELSDFPAGTATDLLMPMPDEPVNSAGRTFYLPGDDAGIANSVVIEYISPQRAAEEFERQLDWRYDVEPTFPPELSYRSSIADNYNISCGSHRENPFCTLHAQYQQYYVQLLVHMRGAMSLEQVNQLLRRVDEEFAGCLGVKLPPTEAP